jgi:hypothetical protein
VLSGSSNSQAVSVPGRGEPDGESTSFLRNKDKELLGKRERDGTAANKTANVSTAGVSTTSATGTGDRQGQRPVAVSDVHSPADATFVVSSQSTAAAALPQSESAVGTSVTAESAKNVVADLHTRTNSSAATSGTKPLSRTVSSSAQPADLLPTSPTLSAASKPDHTLEKPTIPTNAGLAASIPQFYFPNGNPSTVRTTDQGDAVLRKVKDEFEKLDNGKASLAQMGPIVKVPMYSSM